MPHTKRWKKAAMLLLIAATLLGSGCMPAPLRLRILANSDSGPDQRVKLDVRDAVLAATQADIAECQNSGEAKEYIDENLEIIVETANDTLAQKGFGYQAQAVLDTDHFPERRYRGVCYPEGDYEALRIVLGEGEGENWWCVMFPPLCMSELEADGGSALYTSYIAELFHEWFGG